MHVYRHFNLGPINIKKTLKRNRKKICVTFRENFYRNFIGNFNTFREKVCMNDQTKIWVDYDTKRIDF